MRFLFVILVPLIASGAFAQPSAYSSREFGAEMVFNALAWDDGFGGSFGGITSIFYDRRTQELIVADPPSHRILIYDHNLIPKYFVEHSVKARKSDRETPGEPRAAVANSYGDLIVIDNLEAEISILDYRGVPLQRVSVASVLGDSTIQIRPEALAIDSLDNLYVAVSGDIQAIVVLDRDYDLKRKIGKKGTSPEDFSNLLSVSVMDSFLIATDLYAVPSIKVFDTAGTFLLGFGAHAEDRADFSFPSSVVMVADATGAQYFLVTDALRQVIKMFDVTGTFLANIGGFGVNLGEFRNPTALVCDQYGTFFVAEKVGRRLQRFTWMPDN